MQVTPKGHKMMMMMIKHPFADCIKCPVGTEPVLAFEYKWWNTMPKNMMSYTLRQWLSHLENTTGETQEPCFASLFRA